MKPPSLLIFVLLILFRKFQPFKTPLVRAQSQEEFISIDCGLSNVSSYRDESTGMNYVGDSQFVDGGENKIIDFEAPARVYQTLRRFPNGSRNCYRLSPVKSGKKYLIRAGFIVESRSYQFIQPTFDLHLGVNFWATVDMMYKNVWVTEIITVAQRDLIQVCLVNTGGGTPYISLLELRPLIDFMYPLAHNYKSLVNLGRINYGASNDLRYPLDPYDRIWNGVVNDFFLLNAQGKVEANAQDAFQVPSIVLQTAASENRTSGHSFVMRIIGTPGLEIYLVMHFAELEKFNSTNESRQLEIYAADGKLPFFTNYSPPYMRADHKEITGVSLGISGRYEISIRASNSSSLSPMINAVEAFVVRLMNETQTDDLDVSAMEGIKKYFKITKNWDVDPCSPKDQAWKGVSCSYGSSRPARIISLNLSSSGLEGEIPFSIGNLTALKTLDLSNNNLRGSIPDALRMLHSLQLIDLSDNSLKGTIPDTLGELTYLELIDLSKNNLTGAVPKALGDIPSLHFINLSGNEALDVIPDIFCEKIANGNLSISGPQNPCKNSNSNKRLTITVVVTTAASIIIMMSFVVYFCLIKRKRKVYCTEGIVNKKENDEITAKKDGWKRECVKFSSAEIVHMTQNFQHEIGKGGFGAVYLGDLMDGMKVAVKVLSSSSSQGSKEFRAEVIILAKLHHKNLVSLLGYCDDVKYLSLVYEYMDNGTLRDHLSDETQGAKILTWNQRVSIALQSAEGLEYLHSGCRQPIVHRDIKSNNILLNHELTAKISDFGLSKAFGSDSATHITTELAGTPGYLDPEYYQTYRLNEKSDVYSFGIVLLELMTGQPPQQKSIDKTHIVKWVNTKVQSGGITSILDSTLHEDFDIRMAEKMMQIAMACTSINSDIRMEMSEVVMQLKQCLAASE